MRHTKIKFLSYSDIMGIFIYRLKLSLKSTYFVRNIDKKIEHTVTISRIYNDIQETLNLVFLTST